jgi:hypothetical protein
VDWSGRPFSFDPLEFRGSDSDALDRYRKELLAKVSKHSAYRFTLNRSRCVFGGNGDGAPPGV